MEMSEPDPCRFPSFQGAATVPGFPDPVLMSICPCAASASPSSPAVPPRPDVRAEAEPRGVNQHAFGVKHLLPSGAPQPFPSGARWSGVSGLPLPGARIAAAGGPRCGPPATPLGRARLPSGRLCRRLPGGRILDAVFLHHADAARGVPAHHDLPVVGSGIRLAPAVFQDRMKQAVQLVGCGNDGMHVRGKDADVVAELGQDAACLRSRTPPDPRKPPSEPCSGRSPASA